MTALINLQNFDGSFTILENTWNNSVFYFYAGEVETVMKFLNSFQKNQNIPKDARMDLWTTALAMKILELKMPEKKDLWELVVGKARLFLMTRMANNDENCNKFLQAAEKYITTGTN